MATVASVVRWWNWRKPSICLGDLRWRFPKWSDATRHEVLQLLDQTGGPGGRTEAWLRQKLSRLDLRDRHK